MTAGTAENIDAFLSHPDQDFHSLLMQAPVAIVVFKGPEYIIELANDLYLPIAGKTREELINKPAFEAMPVAASQGFIELLDNIRTTGQPVNLREHKTFIEKDGKLDTTYLNIAYQPIKDADDSVAKIMVLVTDVTEQVKTRLKIEEERAILISTREQLDLSISAGNIGVWHWSVKDDVLTWSKEQRNIYGLKEDELFGGKVKDFHAFVVEEDLPRVLAAREKNVDSQYQFRIRRKDGKIRWLQARSRSVYKDGALKYLTGVNIDITDQKTAEEKIRESEQRFVAAVKAVQGILWTNSANGEMQGEQPGWADLTGQSYDEYQGYGWSKAVHPDDAQPTIDAWTEAVSEGKTFVFEHRLKRKDGKWGRFSIRAIPVLENDGSIREWVGVHTDITQQRHAEIALLESERRLRSFAGELEKLVAERTKELRDKNIELENSQSFLQQLIDSSVEYIFVLDKELRFVAGNKPYERTMQLTRGAYKGTYLTDINPDVKGSFQYECLMKALNGETVHLDKRSSIAKPSIFVDTYFIPLKFQDKIEGVIIMSRDVTDIVETEKLLEQKNKELERSNEDLLQFAHVASHDLKEPVRKVSIFGKLIGNEFGDAMPGKAKVYLSKIDNAARRMNAMIDGVLLYSSMDSPEHENEIIDLNELLQQIVADLEVVINEKRAVVKYANLPRIKGLSILIYQLFYNLINNSLKFSKSNVTPVIEVVEEPITTHAKVGHGTNNSVRILVKDNGIGFDNKVSHKIFRTFSRLHAKDKFEGTGLGLALCKKIVQRHGGTIEADGKPDEGATFIITLPA